MKNKLRRFTEYLVRGVRMKKGLRFFMFFSRRVENLTKNAPLFIKESASWKKVGYYCTTVFVPFPSPTADFILHCCYTLLKAQSKDKIKIILFLPSPVIHWK